MALVFEEPANTRINWDEDARTLRQHPGKWARLDTGHLSATTRLGFGTQINAGRVKAFRDGFEAVGSKGETWVRYVGDDA